MSTATEATYRRRIDDWIAGATEDVNSFDELLLFLPSVYPLEVLAGIDRLRDAGALSTSDTERLKARRPARARRGEDLVPGLPPPHPLDFDWRYAASATRLLLNHAERHSAPGDTIALLGTPTLLVAARQRHLNRHLVLLDANPAAVQALGRQGGLGEVLRCNLFTDPIPALGAAVVIADPPWYEEHLDVFLWAAAAVARPGAIIMMSLPGMATRPSVGTERRRFSHAVQSMGLRFVSASPGCLPYVSPPFERNALSAAGWPGLPERWRRGDLVILAVTCTSHDRRRPIAPPENHASWAEWQLASVRLRIRTRAAQPTSLDPRLESLVPGDILPDVSRRHPLRDSVDVWTSGNRVYACSGSALLGDIVHALAIGSNPLQEAERGLGRPLSSSERFKVTVAIRQLRKLIQMESRELAQAGWLHGRGDRHRRAI